MEDKNQEVILEMKDLSISFFNKSGEIQAVRESIIRCIKARFSESSESPEAENPFPATESYG